MHHNRTIAPVVTSAQPVAEVFCTIWLDCFVVDRGNEFDSYVRQDFFGPSQERPELGLGCGGTRMKGINGPAVAQE